MRYLFLIRHGLFPIKTGIKEKIEALGKDEHEEYKAKEELSEENLNTLGYQIRKILDGKSIYLVSSSKVQPVESSKILVSVLGLPSEFEKADWLCSCPDVYWDSIKKLNSMLKDRKEEALIAISHLDIIDRYVIDYIQKNGLGEENIPHSISLKSDEFYNIKLGNCRGYLINLESKIIQELPK